MENARANSRPRIGRGLLSSCSSLGIISKGQRRSLKFSTAFATSPRYRKYPSPFSSPFGIRRSCLDRLLQQSFSSKLMRFNITLVPPIRPDLCSIRGLPSSILDGGEHDPPQWVGIPINKCENPSIYAAKMAPHVRRLRNQERRPDLAVRVGAAVINLHHTWYVTPVAIMSLTPTTWQHNADPSRSRDKILY